MVCGCASCRCTAIVGLIANENLDGWEKDERGGGGGGGRAGKSSDQQPRQPSLGALLVAHVAW